MGVIGTVERILKTRVLAGKRVKSSEIAGKLAFWELSEAKQPPPLKQSWPSNVVGFCFFCLCCRCQGGTLTRKNCYVFIYFLFLCRQKQLQRGIWSRPFRTIFCGVSENACPLEGPKGPKEAFPTRKLERPEKP